MDNICNYLNFKKCTPYIHVNLTLRSQLKKFVFLADYIRMEMSHSGSVWTEHKAEFKRKIMAKWGQLTDI